MTRTINTMVSRQTRPIVPAVQPTCQAVRVSPTAYLQRKGMLDRIIAALLLIPALPIIGCLIVVIRLTSPGPGIYRQRRVGKDGRCFDMLKLRSMRCDAEQGTGAVWCKPSDPRVTLLGRILRKVHLDELPQLFNVLRGEMSLVGPRPERPEFVHVLAEQIPGYMNRLATLPGVTGLAQLNLPPDTDLDSVRRKLVLDVAYIGEGNLWLDFRILLCTAARMFRIPMYRAFGLYRRVELPAIDHDLQTLSLPSSLGVAGEEAASLAENVQPENAQPEKTLAKTRRRKPARPR